MITYSRNITVTSKFSVPPVNASLIASDFRDLPKPTFAHCFSYSSWLLNFTIFPKQKSQQFKAEWLKAAIKGFPCITRSVKKKKKNMQKCRHSCYAKIAKINSVLSQYELSIQLQSTAWAIAVIQDVNINIKELNCLVAIACVSLQKQRQRFAVVRQRREAIRLLTSITCTDIHRLTKHAILVAKFTFVINEQSNFLSPKLIAYFSVNIGGNTIWTGAIIVVPKIDPQNRVVM